MSDSRYKALCALPSAMLLAVLFISRAQAISPHDPAFYKVIIRREADRLQLPPAIAEAVTQVESGFDPAKVGGVGEIGLMQVRPSTAYQLGFRGSIRDLANPETNIRLGVTYLARAWKLAGGDLCRALMKYRAGHGEEIMSPLSAAYCAKASLYLNVNDLGLGVASTDIKGPSPPAAEKAVSKPTPLRLLRGAAFWAVHEARIRVLDAQVEARWRLSASKR